MGHHLWYCACINNQWDKDKQLSFLIGTLSIVTAKRNVVLQIWCLMRFIIYNLLFVFHKVQIFDCELTTVWEDQIQPTRYHDLTAAFHREGWQVAPPIKILYYIACDLSFPCVLMSAFVPFLKAAVVPFMLLR